ncbi:hypothetical protein [Pseudomonas bharatica]|uniref:hypothetical protein n=1 Tax=Pseudomonas bharatica TaxID=2692112 RepID=UPI003B287596
MLFLANVLELNGGTTFILRVAKEYAARGKRVGVLVMFDMVDRKLEEQLSVYADIYRLRSYSRCVPSFVFKSQLGTFMPLDFPAISEVVQRHGGHIHAMGVFGILLLRRMVAAKVALTGVSFGIYHQNEIMYRDVPAYFSDKAQALFARLPSAGVVFFNEHNQRSHAQFFSRNYDASPILPIGVELPAWTGRSIGSSDSLRIVSIGNLHPFKAYNAHIIRMLNRLSNSRPGIRYEIYGAGINESALRDLVKEHDVEHLVDFKGVIGYADIPKVLSGSFAFIGSGTSIIESSALGIPSIVGIESIQAPMTYGLFSKVKGFSYNEMGADIPLVSIEDTLISLNRAEDWEVASAGCRSKAEEFSIARTVDGFERVAEDANELLEFKALPYSNVRALLSFLLWGFKERSGKSSAFSMRREQGTLTNVHGVQQGA